MSDSELALSAAQSFPAPFLIERAGPSTRKSFSSFNGSDPEQEHPPGLLPRDPAVHDLLGASRSASRRLLSPLRSRLTSRCFSARPRRLRSSSTWPRSAIWPRTHGMERRKPATRTADKRASWPRAGYAGPRIFHDSGFVSLFTFTESMDWRFCASPYALLLDLDDFGYQRRRSTPPTRPRCRIAASPP